MNSIGNSLLGLYNCIKTSVSHGASFSKVFFVYNFVTCMDLGYIGNALASRGETVAQRLPDLVIESALTCFFNYVKMNLDIRLDFESTRVWPEDANEHLYLLFC